jgi:dynactin complex subunit
MKEVMNTQAIVDEMSSRIQALTLENIILSVKVKEMTKKIEELNSEDHHLSTGH